MTGRQAFPTERDASVYLAERLTPFFHLVPEVRLTHYDGSKLRIDYVAVVRPSVEFRVPIFGIEVKVEYGGFREFSRALKQAIDYRHSTITDNRSSIYQGQVLPFVFVWPDMRDQVNSYDQWIAGAERIAGQFNVGLIREQTTWQSEPYIEFRVAGSPFWRSYQGNSGGERFGMARKRGAA